MFDDPSKICFEKCYKIHSNKLVLESLFMNLQSLQCYEKRGSGTSAFFRILQSLWKQRVFLLGTFKGLFMLQLCCNLQII